MKKNLFLVAGMFFCASTFIGCSNEENLTSSNEFTVKATMGVESRTELGEDYSTITWCEDDKIYLFGNGADVVMHLINGAGTGVGEFSGTVNGFPYALNKALYPIPTINGNEFSYDLPSQRTYSKNSGAPLWGPFANGLIEYKNLVAMIRVPLAASAVERTLKLQMKGIAGKLVVDVENGTASMASSATDEVTVTVPAGEACFIDIPVPAKSYPDGYRVLLDGSEIAGTTSEVSLDSDDVKVILNEPSTENTDGSYMIATSADLLWLAKQVNTGADTFVGKTFVMTDDIDLSGIAWTPIGINTEMCFKGTFDGQDHTISNLSVAVEGTASAGLFANGAGATIKNLTLENVNVNGNYMTGVVMGDGSCATILNCHVNGGSVTSTPHLVGGKYDDGNNAGGIVGYLAADGGNASVTGCSVTGLVITAYRDVAGIAGTATGSGYIPVVSDNVVSNTTIIADQTVDYAAPKAANAGEIVGRKQVEPTMSGYTVTNVIVKTLVATATQLQNALNYTIDGQNIILTDDITGDVTAAQKPNVKITIEGNNHIFAGVLLVDGKSGTYTTAGFTIKNLNFKAESISADACIRLGDGTNATRYTCNVTVEGCTFDVPGAVGVKSYTGGDKNLTIKGCTATTNAHSLIQAKGIDGVLIEGCYVYSKNGMNFNNSNNVSIIGCEANVKGYAVRFGESSNSYVENYSICDSYLRAACEEFDDAVIVFRKGALDAHLILTNTTLIGAREFIGKENVTIN